MGAVPVCAGCPGFCFCFCSLGRVAENDGPACKGRTLTAETLMVLPRVHHWCHETLSIGSKLLDQ